ncbi:MAG: cell division protein ZapA [Magnetococcales bacterium]|nr:cell division protein ZapA [Magnetococcales bacterium]
MKDAIEISIHGQRFKLRTDEDEEYVTSLAAYVEEMMAEMGASSNSLTNDRIAIMAAFQIADSFFRYRQQSERRQRQLMQRLRTLIADSDQVLEE